MVRQVHRYPLRTLGTKNPRNTPAGQSEALGQAVNDENIILVDILDVLSSRNGATVTIARIVVARVELVADKGGAATANILDLGQLGVCNDTAGGVTGVRGQNDRGSTGDLLGDAVGVDMVAVLLGERNRNGGELSTQCQMLCIVSCFKLRDRDVRS